MINEDETSPREIFDGIYIAVREETKETKLKRCIPDVGKLMANQQKYNERTVEFVKEFCNVVKNDPKGILRSLAAVRYFCQSKRYDERIEEILHDEQNDVLFKLEDCCKSSGSQSPINDFGKLAEPVLVALLLRTCGVAEVYVECSDLTLSVRELNLEYPGFPIDLVAFNERGNGTIVEMTIESSPAGTRKQIFEKLNKVLDILEHNLRITDPTEQDRICSTYSDIMQHLPLKLMVFLLSEEDVYYDLEEIELSLITRYCNYRLEVQTTVRPIYIPPSEGQSISLTLDEIPNVSLLITKSKSS